MELSCLEISETTLENLEKIVTFCNQIIEVGTYFVQMTVLNQMLRKTQDFFTTV